MWLAGCAGQLDLYEAMLQRFYRSQADFLQQLHALCDCGAGADAARLAHAMRTMANGLGAQKLAHASQLAESFLGSGGRPDAPEWEPLWQALQQHFAEAWQALAAHWDQLATGTWCRRWCRI